MSLQMGSIVPVGDNSGAKTVFFIKPQGGTGKRHAKLGDIGKVSVRSAIPNGKVKPGEVYNAVVVRQPSIRRPDGSTVRFSGWSVVLLDKSYELIGTRVFGPMPRELRNVFPKILSLAQEVL